MEIKKSEALFQEAVQYIPGGVNSPVRAFGSIGSTPRFIKKADKALMWDEDGNEYIDFIGSWGPMILGHNHPLVLDAVMEYAKSGLSYGAATSIEVDMAKLICSMVPSIEMVRMVNSGTEAVMSAVRVARGFTRRDKIIKFNGCYHGHSDALLVKAGSGVMTAGVPGSLGVPAGCTADTITADYNSLESVQNCFDTYGEQIAAILVEPVGANMGTVPPKPGFLQGLRDICDKYGALLIFDEVITGFRMQADGAQGYFGVTPDLTTFGKIIGAGMPVGAYGGRREIMEMVSPVGAVYQAGTLSGNPVAMAAGIAQLSYLKEHPEAYAALNQKSDRFFEELQKIVDESGRGYHVNHITSLGSLFFTDREVVDYESAQTSDTKAYADYCNYMQNHGIYLAPAQFEAVFISMEHTEEQLARTLELARTYFTKNK